jgi:methylmalonyl-CoA/ethylmalonyl-CoA epimerase
MIQKIDHVAIAVRNLEESKKKFIDLYGAKFVVEKVNTEGQYKVAIFKLGESTMTLLESTSPDGFIAKHVEKVGEGVQHIGFEVDNLAQFIQHLQTRGVKTAAFMEIEGVRKEVLVGAKNGFGVVWQVFEWLGEYKKKSPEERMTKVWG